MSETRKTYVWHFVTLAAIVMLATAFVTGCVIDLQGDGKAWFETGHRFEVGHRADKSTPDQRSVAEWNLEPSKDIINGIQEAVGDGEDPGGG